MTDTPEGLPRTTTPAVTWLPAAPPDACDLDADRGVDRLARWRQLADRAAPEAELHGRILRVRYRPQPGVLDELQHLAALERLCCAQLTWQAIELHGAPTLLVEADAGASDAILDVARLFGAC